MHHLEALPHPPSSIYGDCIRLQFSHIFPGNATFGQVHGYHFRIIAPGNVDAGHINFRIGDTPHIREIVGHIGYEIVPAQRGHGYAEKACRALAPFASKHYRSVIITADPANLVSIHIIEKLGARFLNEVAVPSDDIAYASGARRKKRYQWNVAIRAG
ncbi:MAG: GNAT family N-acetyltransferase [Verrucomicrobiales bacterium]|nr:GNAT family N-acetyltransferase [Verrucomicrobiae bacterium]